jgi:2-polyprenyl-3-methyl-5-hydroxy-6-metoxy-1,4-benzoquinol methylase
MDYSKKIYETYVSIHTSFLYGKTSIDAIKRQFPVWKRYYGRFLPEDKDAKILDLGCGNGGFVYFLQTLGYKNAIGLDISKEQIELANKLGIKNIFQSDLKEFLSEKKEIYDVLFARDVIEHFTKDEIFEILIIIFSSLKKDGIVLIQTPNAEGPFGSRYRYRDFTHEISFTSSSLNDVLRVVGFRNIEFYSTGPVPKGLKSTARYILWKGIETILRFYMLVETGSGKGFFTQNIVAVAKK